MVAMERAPIGACGVGEVKLARGLHHRAADGEGALLGNAQAIGGASGQRKRGQ